MILLIVRLKLIFGINVQTNNQTGYTLSLSNSDEDTSNVANMADMFYRLDRITSLDLSSFNTSNVRSFPGIFQNASRLQTIKATSNFIVRDGVVSNDMFGNNTQLVGGNGTTHNELSPKDKTYDHIDVPGNPGYFAQGS